jgi:Holliday junction resolvase
MSRQRAKGTRAESAVVAYLREVGFDHAERRALNGAQDKGDIAGIASVCIEVKDHRELRLAEFVDEAVAEGDNARADVAVAWIKRRGKASPADWYVAMTGTQFVSLLIDAGYLELRRAAAVTTGETA